AARGSGHRPPRRDHTTAPRRPVKRGADTRRDARLRARSRARRRTGTSARAAPGAARCRQAASRQAATITLLPLVERKRLLALEQLDQQTRVLGVGCELLEEDRLPVLRNQMLREPLGLREVLAADAQ